MIAFALFVACTLFGAYLGQRRGRTTAGLLWSFFLGPVGWCIILLGPNPRRDAEARAEQERQRRTDDLQRQHLEELRQLRAEIWGQPKAEDAVGYYLRTGDKVRGPLDMSQLLDLLAERKLTLDTEVAPAANPGQWSPLSQVLPGSIRVRQG